MTEQFDGRRKPPPRDVDVLDALGTLLTEYALINTLLDRAKLNLTTIERAQKQASNQTFNRIRSIYRRATGIA